MRSLIFHYTSLDFRRAILHFAFFFQLLTLSTRTASGQVIDSLQFTIQQRFDTGVVLLVNNNGLIPLRNYKHQRQLNILTGEGFSEADARRCWEWYGRTSIASFNGRPDYQTIHNILDAIRGYDQIFIHLMPTDNQFSQQIINFIEMIPEKGKTVLVIYDSETLLGRINGEKDFAAIVLADEPRLEALSAVVRGIFGGIPFTGTTVSGMGIHTRQTRINFSSSWVSGINPVKFATIDSIVADAMARGAFPGCQVLAILKGNVIYEKSFGYHTWDKQREVLPTDLYDLASLTKILATTPALIQLEHEGIIQVHHRLGTYLPLVGGSDKEDLKIMEILSHRARLQAWIPFYKMLVTNGHPDTTIFSRQSNFHYPVQVCDSLYITSSYTDTMLQMIQRSPLIKKHTYLYSDLGMILLKYAIEEQTKVPFEEYLDNRIYDPLNLFSMGFNPLRSYPAGSIVPTEDDRYFRNCLVHGFVHDPAAAMMGGVAGHAGLFANARDVGVLMYTLANGGEYGGVQLFNPGTIDEFNQRHYRRIRRGLGFDKPETTPGYKPNVTSYASPSSFGHSGFTGTFTWADPDKDLIYVFLSNRVHPSGENPLLTQLGVRAKIHAVLYEALPQ